jgi:protein-L-isoaspartate(D-aspartate) O-methyltransferase
MKRWRQWTVLLLTAIVGVTEPHAADTEPDPYAAKRRRMVDDDIAARGVEDEATLHAMRTVPRHRFVPPEYVAHAYADRPLPIGHGQTISQPYIVGYMTEQLRLQPADRVLEIGTGSGYQAAVLAAIVGEVFTIEIVPPLAERARALLLDELQLTNVSVRAGDGFVGWPEVAPFDAIIVTAAAETIPPPLLAQLKDGGRMIIPVGPPLGAQYLVLATKDGDRVRTRTLLPVRFVPFTRAE